MKQQNVVLDKLRFCDETKPVSRPLSAYSSFVPLSLAADTYNQPLEEHLKTWITYLPLSTGDRCTRSAVLPPVAFGISATGGRIVCTLHYIPEGSWGNYTATALKRDTVALCGGERIGKMSLADDVIAGLLG